MLPQSSYRRGAEDVLFIVRQFPLVSQTFIFDQMAAVEDAGLNVRVLALFPEHAAPIQESLEGTQFFKGARYASLGSGNLKKFLSVALALAKIAQKRPSLIRRIFRFKRRGRSLQDVGLLIFAAAVLLRERWDPACVVANFGPIGLMSRDLRELGLIDAPIVCFFHGYDVEQVPRKLGTNYYRDLFGDAEKLLVASPHFARVLSKFGCPEDKPSFFPVGIDIGRFPQRETFNFASRPVRILSVARLMEKKGHKFAIQAVAQIASRFEVEYSIVGDGPLLQELQSQVRQLGLGDRVRFLGAKTHGAVLQALSAAHVFLQPSVTAADGDQEAIPVTLKEAMAVGVPVVATRHGGIEKLIADGLTGLLVDERDSEQLADRLTTLIADPDLAKALVYNARNAITSSWDNAAIMRRFVQLLSDLAQLESLPEITSG